MIVLDEQLLGRNVELEIARWYRGTIRFLPDLRPSTIIKDEVVPILLRSLRQPTFVTINERDFWLRAPADDRYCLICFATPDSHVREIPGRLRELFRHEEFRTKSRRMGKIIRVTDRSAVYYSRRDLPPTAVRWPG